MFGFSTLCEEIGLTCPQVVGSDIGHTSPQDGDPREENTRAWVLMVCLFASMSYPARAKGSHERPLHCLGTRGMSILRTLTDYDAWSSVWKTDGFLAVC